MQSIRLRFGNITEHLFLLVLCPQIIIYPLTLFYPMCPFEAPFSVAHFPFLGFLPRLTLCQHTYIHIKS